MMAFVWFLMGMTIGCLIGYILAKEPEDLGYEYTIYPEIPMYPGHCDKCGARLLVKKPGKKYYCAECFMKMAASEPKEDEG